MLKQKSRLPTRMAVGGEAGTRHPSVFTAQRERRADSRPSPRVVPLHEKTVADKVIEYIEANYAAQISLRDVAQALGYSPCHLTHTFRESTGTPVTAWIIKRRIVAAQQLLRESNANVAAAAEAVGFNDLCYFTRQFVRHVGVTPGRFRSAASVPGYAPQKADCGQSTQGIRV